MLLANPADPSMDAMRRQYSRYWFALTGVRCPMMFAKFCGVDVSPDILVSGSVVQTSVVRASAVIVRHDIEDVLGYYLLGDSSTILYMWTYLADAMKEFDGQVLTLPASDDREHTS